MSETYCGKTCEGCKHKENLKCSGCKNESGKVRFGECGIAKCCRDRQYEACGSCLYEATCGTLKKWKYATDMQLNKYAREAEAKKKFVQRAPFISKWILVLFWLTIAGIVINFMDSESLMLVNPFLYLTGRVLYIISVVIMGISLLKLSSENDLYRTAAICNFANAAYIAITSFFGINSLFSFILTIVMLVVSLIGAYSEFTGHSEILQQVDSELSEKWGKLWRFFIIALIAEFGSLIVMLILPILGALVALAAAVATIIASIMKIVYLHKTATCFKALN